MSTELLNIEGGPLTTNNIKVLRYCCAKEVITNKLASDRRSISLTINHPLNAGPGEIINLTYNQAIMLAETILEGLK
jgi:hypothetical protein